MASILTNDLTDDDVLCVLNALENKLSFINDQDESSLKRFCCHSHEKEFLNRNDSKLLNRCPIITLKRYGALRGLYQRMSLLADKEPSLEHLKSEFFKLTESKHYTEVLLFCATLVTDFHLDYNCSKYMSLAFKFYLRAYEFIQYSYHEESATVVKDLLDYLKHITLYKCQQQHELFSGYINGFFKYYGDVRAPFKYGDDFFYPILNELFEMSYKIQFDLLSFLNRFHMEYTQRSILMSLRRYMILAKHCYEDRYCEEYNHVNEYKRAILLVDHYGVLSCQHIKVREFNNVMYRSVQVLFLYIKCIFFGKCGDSIIGEEALRCLWETVPDPILTKNQFLSCFEELPADVQPELLKAWEWYKKSVLIEHEPENSPRSLRHISRCVIRRTLRASFHSIDCVKSLDIPVTLKNYLCLK